MAADWRDGVRTKAWHYDGGRGAVPWTASSVPLLWESTRLPVRAALSIKYLPRYIPVNRA